ncbi:peptidase U62 modulator of DNA gyrase [Ignisphaera aggregans DSM 17230]|uniref:Peptidase U62 modulator of DNA gyrase n=1 Tax=Ignisphaera aggregans (strain DSM 17230 / JCM 13409 / AQ1.S1) TaxID=583356 RepID=E0SS27_IGNAA|nr:peptidase U62 modulator of DNA gyrase [Ignisphaera aggregans DSM 17230]
MFYMSSYIDYANKIVRSIAGEGFDEVAILIRDYRRVMAKIANSEPSVVQRWSSFDVSLYLSRNRRIMGLELHPKSIDDVMKPIERLIEIADKISESPLYAPLPRPSKISFIGDTFDSSIINYMDNISRLTEIVIEVSHREKIDSVAGVIQLGYIDELLATSTDVVLSEKKTFLQSSIRAFSEPDGSGQWSFTSTKIDIDGLIQTASIASRYAVDSKNRRNIEPGIYNVILSPMVFGNLLDYIVNMATGFSILFGTSIFMKNRVGDKVASDKLSVYDCPRDSSLPGARSFDHEGLETFNKPIIENGVLKNILHNTKTARALNAISTANAGWISPTPWNIYVAPGDIKIDDMIRDIGRGILITNNWYTRLQNYVEGIFSTIARDAIFYIENGNLIPITKIRIADTFPRILNNIEMIGKELYNIQWWEVETPSRLPYVAIKDVHISKHII